MKMKRRYYTSNIVLPILQVLLVFTISSVFGQKVETVIETREVVIPMDDSTVITHVYVLKKKKNVSLEKQYYWFHNNGINVNRGMYMKNPLHGSYYVFDNDKKMLTQGVYKMGLRVGEWKYWYASGELKSVVEYSAGLKNGSCTQFSEMGKPACINNYKAGKLHGKQKEFVGDSVIVTEYKNGVAVTDTANRECKIFAFLRKDKKQSQRSRKIRLSIKRTKNLSRKLICNQLQKNNPVRR